MYPSIRLEQFMMVAASDEKYVSWIICWLPIDQTNGDVCSVDNGEHRSGPFLLTDIRY